MNSSTKIKVKSLTAKNIKIKIHICIYKAVHLRGINYFLKLVYELVKNSRPRLELKRTAVKKWIASWRAG